MRTPTMPATVAVVAVHPRTSEDREKIYIERSHSFGILLGNVEVGGYEGESKG